LSLVNENIYLHLHCNYITLHSDLSRNQENNNSYAWFILPHLVSWFIITYSS